MNISYDWYKIFYQVALAGNITIAAENLFISQPAVSQSIKQLEKSLGCKLFIRSSKGVRLTAEGELLYTHISRGIQQIELAEKSLSSFLNLESGEIHIGASDMTLEYYLLPYLEKYHRKYPNIKISITNVPTPETLHLLKENIIDFGVISEPINEIKDFEVFPVREIEDIFIAGKEFEEFSNTPMSLESLTELPLILLEPNTSTRKYVNDFLKKNQVTISPEFELATSSLIVQFVKRNLGIGCVVRDFAKDDIENGDIFEIKLKKIIPPRNMCIVKKQSMISYASSILLEDILIEKQ